MYDSSLFLIAAAKRREKGLSLDQISSVTKISTRSLRAIEEGDFRKLPGGIYNTSYIRQYARAVDVDEAELVAVYHASTAGPAKPSAKEKGSLKRFLPAMQQ